jgi:hypothetical protein
MGNPRKKVVLGLDAQTVQFFSHGKQALLKQDAHPIAQRVAILAEITQKRIAHTISSFRYASIDVCKGQTELTIDAFPILFMDPQHILEQVDHIAQSVTLANSGDSDHHSNSETAADFRLKCYEFIAAPASSAEI